MNHRLAAIASVLLALSVCAVGAAPTAQTPGPVRQWTVLGPFPNPVPEGGRSAKSRGGHDVDCLAAIGGEAKAVVRRATTIAGAAARVVSCPSGRLDFAPLYPDNANKLAYAYAEVKAGADQDALFFLGSDDGAKVWLNGKLVWDSFPVTGRAFREREDRFSGRLRKGVNRLLVKVENMTGGWELGVEVFDAASAKPILAEESRLRRVRDSLNLEIEPLQTYPGYVFEPGPFPRVGWRDAELARTLIGSVPLKVRWFDADLNEVKTAAKPGRYMAYVEGKLASGTPIRRGLTFYCKPGGTLQSWLADWGLDVPHLGPPIDEAVWRERSAATSEMAGRLFRDALLSNGSGAVFLAAMAGAKPTGRAPRFVDSPDVIHSDYQVALKRKLLGLQGQPRALAPPRSRAGSPAKVIREGDPAEAGMTADAKTRIDAVCRTWAEKSGEPFSLLVARHGVVVTHEGFGALRPGVPCTTDFRYEVASITKAVSGILFSQFVDQGIAAIDDPVGAVLPGFPTSGPRALTYRHCFTHTSGFEGHGDWGGIWNPYFDNILLQWLPALKPGTRHIYNGLGYDLAGKAMEVMVGKSIPRLFTDHLFAPLGFEDVPLNDMAFGARLTARELAVLGQWLANKGSYGDKEFISEATYAKLLPRQLKQFWPAVNVEWGIGLTHMPDRRTGAPAASTDPKDFTLGPRTIGHGSATSCILRVDPDQDLVIAMIRRTAGPGYDEHARTLFAAVADGIVK